MTYVNKLKRTLPIVIFPLISYLLLSPLEVYFGNQKDFSFYYQDFFLILLGVFLILSIIGTTILSLFSEKLNLLLLGVVFYFGLASYIQNMFLNIKLSENDGSPMQWDTLKGYQIVNTAAWLAIAVIVIVVYIVLKKYFRKIITYGALFFGAIQLVACVSLLVTPQTKDNSSLQLSGEKQYSIAAKDNIIVFVLDTFGNTQLENALKVYPNLLNSLSDFTFYNNADCHYYCTFPSMTHFLTGNELDFNAKTSEDWMNDSWNSEKAQNFYNELHKEDYKCYLFSDDIGYVYGSTKNLYGKFDNVTTGKTKVDKQKLTYLMSKMSIYKYSPYIIKPKFEVLNNEFSEVVTILDTETVITDNANYYTNLGVQKLSIDKSTNNALIIQHLFGTHKPYTTNYDASYIEEAEVDATISGLFTILNEYFTQLKEIGAYDKSTIIITADHGSWFGNDPQPIFFIKQSNETHDAVQYNTAPISLDDFQATIMSLIGKDHTKYGTSIFDWQEGQEREREVYMRYTDDKYPDVKNSSFNVYYGYKYLTDKTEVNNKLVPDEIISATPWK